MKQTDAQVGTVPPSLQHYMF